MKQAKLIDVNFCVRVVVDEDTTDSELNAMLKEKIRERLDNDEVLENIVAEEEDSEVPYNPEFDKHDFKYCRIRPDLQAERKRIPYDGGSVSGNAHIPYKWEGDDKFFIWMNGGWKEAESIDFEFEPFTKFYRLWDKQTGRYMATGYNTASKEELAKECVGYKSGGDMDNEEEEHLKKLSTKEIIEFIENDEFDIEESDVMFEENEIG